VSASLFRRLSLSGAFEYFSFAELLTDVFGKPTRVVWVINAGVGNKDWIDPVNIGSWVQDALDTVEFAVGPVSSVYGAVRASMGHPAPFRLDYLAMGQ
jgi:alpha-L-arabinofuranosidase